MSQINRFYFNVAASSRGRGRKCPDLNLIRYDRMFGAMQFFSTLHADFVLSGKIILAPIAFKNFIKS